MDFNFLGGGRRVEEWGGGLVKWGVILEKQLLLNINCPISLFLMEKHLMK